MNSSTIAITTVAESEVLRKIETSVLLELHEKINVSGFLTNAESWDLTKGDRDELDKIEIQAIKLLFDLPLHTPTPAILYSFGLLYTRFRVDQKQLIYLKRILERDPNHWTRKTLEELRTRNIGWYKTITETLTKYGLPISFDEIMKYRVNAWNQKVRETIERQHKNRITDECYKTEDGFQIPKTKTLSIANTLATNDYSRTPQQEFIACNKQEAKNNHYCTLRNA